MNEVVKLREENEDLKYEVQSLRDLLISGSRLPRHFGLAPTEERILGLLLKLAPRPAKREALLAAMSSNRDDPPEPKGVDVRISHIRRKLRAPIIPVYGEGYYIPADAAERLRDMLGLAA